MKGLVEKITGCSAGFSNSSSGPRNTKHLCESCSINIGCVKKMVVAKSLMFQLVDSCRKISYAPLVTITLTSKLN